jgi:hypothetical protein
MNNRICRWVIILFALFVSPIRSDSVLAESKNIIPELTLKVDVYQFYGRNRGRIIIRNFSDNFLCINSRVFNPIYQHILFKYKDGRFVRLKVLAEPAYSFFLGFDYFDAYHFIKPKETREIGFDLSNFMIGPGSYNYVMTFPYYLCQDVIDRERIKSKRNITVFGTQGRGELTIPEEKWKSKQK